MQAIATAIILSWGWRRALIAFGAGAASALAQAPYDVLPVLFLTLPVLVLLIEGATPANAHGVARLTPAARIGWFFGFGYFLAGVSWIGSAFFVEADVFGWMAPFAILGFPAYLALYTALGAALARLLWSDGWARILALALGLGIAEWLRGTLFTGFPWNSFGQALVAFDLTGQILAVTGVTGASLLAVTVFAAPAALLAGEAGTPRGRAGFVVFAVLLACLVVGFGALRLSSATDATVPGVALRIVQPNVNQAEKWDPANARAALDQLLTLSAANESPDRPGIVAVTHLVWPETALPFFLTENPQALVEIGALLPPGTTLVTGAPRFADEGGVRRYFNSVYRIDDTGRIADAYDKVHLVPFGEYLPFGGILERAGLSSLTRLAGGFTPGVRARTLDVPGAPPMAPLICYEIIFPGAGIDPEARPGWIVNVTNDGWFGVTAGPYQHLALARMKAIAEGLPVARAANTGISGIIDAYGRVRAELGLSQTGVVDGALPVALPPTIYSRAGQRVTLILLLALLAPVALAGRAGAARGAGAPNGRDPATRRRTAG